MLVGSGGGDGYAMRRREVQCGDGGDGDEGGVKCRGVYNNVIPVVYYATHKC